MNRDEGHHQLPSLYSKLLVKKTSLFVTSGTVLMMLEVLFIEINLQVSNLKFSILKQLNPGPTPILKQVCVLK